MTNRRDLIDDALTRPGRMEVQMEIGELYLFNLIYGYFHNVHFPWKQLNFVRKFELKTG